MLVKRILLGTLGCVFLALGVVLGIIGAAAAFLGVAFLVSNTVVLCAVAVLVCFAVVFGMSWLGTRWIGRRRRRPIALGTAAGVLVLLVLTAAFTLFKTFSSPSHSAAQPVPESVRFFDLATGSRIAYLKMSANPRTHDEVVIFVHGGPGAGIVTNEAVVSALEAVAREGFDVYLYDQIGGGLSARLERIEDYTVSRHVADLEAFRRRIGDSKVILIGKSWGAQLTTRYVAEFPQNVARCVFVSPGPLYPQEWEAGEAGSVSDRLSKEKKDAFNRLLTPRVVTAMLLLRINPRAAVRFLPESEADAFGAAVFTSLIEGTVCDPAHVPGNFRGELSVWTSQMTARDLKKLDMDLSERLASVDIPVLVLRGECDYGKWEVAYQYKELFVDSRLLLVKDAGHMLFLDQPEIFVDAVCAFLLDEPLPFPVYTDSVPPTEEAPGSHSSQETLHSQ
jgi:proline iminopeptidase